MGQISIYTLDTCMVLNYTLESWFHCCAQTCIYSFHLINIPMLMICAFRSFINDSKNVTHYLKLFEMTNEIKPHLFYFRAIGLINCILQLWIGIDPPYGAECWPTKRRHVQQLSVAADVAVVLRCCGGFAGTQGGIESGTKLFGIGSGWHQLRRNLSSIG